MSKISIKSAALSYQKLFDYEYQFTVVRNRNTQPINICIRFDKSTFHHLCGLHKLKDIEVVRREKRESVFDKIIDGTYSDELFQKSTWYDEILDRIDCLEHLEAILDDKDTIFKFNPSANKSSKIDADYIIKNETLGLRYYFLVSQNDTDNFFFGRSCFTRGQNERDFTIGHTSYTILRKVKIDLREEKEPVELFIADSYKQQLEQHTKEPNEKISAEKELVTIAAASGSTQKDKPQTQPYMSVSQLRKNALAQKKREQQKPHQIKKKKDQQSLD